MYFFYYIFLAFPFFIPFALADEGVPINLRKYSRVAKGERLRLVKERLTMVRMRQLLFSREQMNNNF